MMPSVVFNVKSVDEGLIFWTDYFGHIEVWTQTKNYGDLIFQFDFNCPLSKNPYDVIMADYQNGVLIFEGDDENV